jgi:hypothetical protein
MHGRPGISGTHMGGSPAFKEDGFETLPFEPAATKTNNTSVARKSDLIGRRLLQFYLF